MAPGIRPTSGRLRGALFSIWADRLEAARFLDLFAGSGAVGLEALSRGALTATFVESARPVLERLERNLRLAPTGSVRMVKADVPTAIERLAATRETFDLIFVDPPYARLISEELLSSLAPIAAPGAELAIEHSRRNPPPQVSGGWVRREDRRYGESALAFYVRIG